MNLVFWFLLVLSPLGQFYTETPRTEPVVAVHWNDAVFSGFCVGHNRVLAAMTAKEPGPKSNAAIPEVEFSVTQCVGGDQCFTHPVLQVPAKILRKEPGPKGTMLLLLSAGQVPPAKLTPYHLAQNADDDEVHFGIWAFGAAGKLRSENEAGVRTVSSSLKGKAWCKAAIGMPVFQGPGPEQGDKDSVAGIVAGCDSEDNLQIVPASKLQGMLSQSP
jgi:hypothetical protein